MIDYNNSIYSSLPQGLKTLIITDSNVAELYLDGLHNALSERECNVSSMILPAGEESKNLSNVEKIYEELSADKFSRADYIVALGGGVITDISGYAAATYLRGIKFVSIPTSLLAMVDAAHGGKCGVDLKCGKNLVGTFYEPTDVICDYRYLSTLPKAVFTDGMAEVIKYAFIMDEALFDILNDASCLYDNMDIVGKVVEMCIADKKAVVAKDRYDFGIRRILNFGHTYAHALEQISGYKVGHGFAVSLGMIKITELAVKKGLCSEDVLSNLKKMLISNDLPVDYSRLEVIRDIPKDKLDKLIEEEIKFDKKHDGDVLMVVIVDLVGSAKIIPYGELL